MARFRSPVRAGDKAASVFGVGALLGMLIFSAYGAWEVLTDANRLLAEVSGRRQAAPPRLLHRLPIAECCACPDARARASAKAPDG